MHLPHLRPFAPHPLVFLTACVYQRRQVLASDAAHDILRDLWAKSAKLNGWYVGQYLLMPDHVHFFAAPSPAARPLADWMRIWKSMSATRINQFHRQTGPLWQADYFDRFIRSLDDYNEKWNYVALNPVRKDLAVNPEDWPYRGVIHDLRYDASRS
ncbi:MAG: transposase [Opitutae bacterium]|nr:transposase [Opitutae bacterium]